jgi:hypothetical protein
MEICHLLIFFQQNCRLGDEVLSRLFIIAYNIFEEYVQGRTYVHPWVPLVLVG